MQEFLYNIMPNVIDKLDDFVEAIGDTLLMVAWSGAISFVLGMIFGILLIVTRPGGIMQNRVVYQVLDKLINFFRSIPFIILLTAVMPLSRLIMGTAIYVRGLSCPWYSERCPFSPVRSRAPWRRQIPDWWRRLCPWAPALSRSSSGYI